MPISECGLACPSSNSSSNTTTTTTTSTLQLLHSSSSDSLNDHLPNHSLPFLGEIESDNGPVNSKHVKTPFLPPFLPPSSSPMRRWQYRAGVTSKGGPSVRFRA